MTADENFLGRWSRRKRENAQDEGRPAPADDKPAAAAAAPAPAAPPARGPRAAPELPSIDSLKGLASDYKGFLSPDIDDGVRRAALKKLFQDPHFNVMDGLDVYIDDYSKPDPIPESMLKQLLERHRALTAPSDQDAEQRAETPAAVADGADTGDTGDTGATAPAQPDPPAPAGDESKSS